MTSPDDREETFDEWLARVDADMQASVESAVDVEAELAEVKRRAAADESRESTP